MATLKLFIFYLFEIDPHNPWPRLPDRQAVRKAALQVGLLAILFGILYGLMTFIPEGFDWHHFFGQGRFPIFWMPWTKPVVALFSLPAMSAMTVLLLIIRTYRYNHSPLPAALALFSLPTIWVIIYLGNVDGLVLLGLMTLPWGVPLVLIKPQVASFALLARRRWLAVAGLWLAVSLLIWGFWPLNLMILTTPEWKAEWVQDITIFPWGILLALPLMWFSRGDEDLLMAAGSLATPHLFPYHFIVLLPALGRMHWPWMLLTWAVTWTPLLANWLGPIGWHFGNLMSLVFWFGIYLNKPKALPAPNQHANP